MKRKIVVEIDCDGDTCTGCECVCEDYPSVFCGAFKTLLDDTNSEKRFDDRIFKRLQQCKNAEVNDIHESPGVDPEPAI